MKTDDLRLLIDKHLADEEYSDSLKYCNTLVKEHEKEITFDDLFKTGLCHFKLDQNEDAIRCFDRALEMEPDNLLAITNKAGSLYNLKRIDEAFALFRTALNINPNVFPPWHYMVLHFLKKYRESGDNKTKEKLVNTVRHLVCLAPDYGNLTIHDPSNNEDCRLDVFLIINDKVEELPIDEIAIP